MSPSGGLGGTGADSSRRTKTRKSVLAIDVHGTATANTLTATPPEGQSRVEFVLDADKGVEDHGTRLVEIEGVALHARLLGRLVGVPSVDVKCLDLRLRFLAGLLHGASLGGWREGRLAAGLEARRR